MQRAYEPYMPGMEMKVDEVAVKLYAECLIFIIMGICYLISVFRRTRWFQWERTASDMQAIIKRNEKKLNFISKTAVGLVLVFLFAYMVVPAVQDFPHVMSEEYETAEGTVADWDFSDEDHRQMRSIGIVEAGTGEKFHAVVYSEGIHEGEYLRITCLPHSRYGIAEKIEK